MGNPAPLGLLCFGMTTLALMYVEMGWVEADFEVVVAGLAIALGGFGQILVGIFELIKGSSFSFAVFECYGAFWVAWANVFVKKRDLESTFGDTSHSDGSTFYFAQWGILTSCFCAIAWRKNMALIVTLALLATTFFLLAIATQTDLDEWRKCAGYVGALTAVSAFYMGVAELVNEEYGQHVLPGLRPLHNPHRLAIEKTILSRINYNIKTNTLFVQFRGLHIKKSDDVESIRRAIENCILENSTTSDDPRKVHFVADYEQCFIASEIAKDYWDMAANLERRYYLSATRFHVSSFGTRSNEPAGKYAVNSNWKTCEDFPSTKAPFDTTERG